ncbi:MAG: hypothetical protein ACI9CF_001664 [Candidatus Omnitrophota bacterium]|jgi:hypothetical protein
MSSNDQVLRNRRKYVRMDSMFPVEMVMHDEDGKRLLPILQGFTQDICEGGLCVRYYKLNANTVDFLDRKFIRVEVQITIPFKPYVISAIGRVSWLSVDMKSEFPQAQFGVDYEEIEDDHRKILLGHAKTRKRRPMLIGVLIAVLVATIGCMLFYQHTLLVKQKQLIGSIVNEAEMRQGGMIALDGVSEQEKELTKELKRIQSNLKKTSDQMSMSDLDANKKIALEKEFQSFIMQESEIKTAIRVLKEKQVSIQAKVFLAPEKIDEGHKLIAAELHSWLLNHTNRITGLVPSYEGDQAFVNVGFTYDQALVAIVHSLLGQPEAAQKILTFFATKAKKASGGFVNAYEVVSGNPTEWTVHVGPNVWVGIAAMQYQELVGGQEFLRLAENVGDWLIQLQGRDADRGLVGGPDVDWYSTEHHLDAYAFFGMLYDKTDKPKYKKARNEMLQWIMRHAADRKGNTFKRGKGDATIATDTFSWALATIGPKELAKQELDPEGIMEFAESHCRVTASFKRPDDHTVNITGFDFAKPQHVARGGIVSSEWTAQAVVTYRILANYFGEQGLEQKQAYYRQKVRFYLNEMQKMIISSLSKTGQGKGCLPYATQANTPTGHGWRTPQGHRTGSVAGTAYGIFAWYGYNPFELDA